MREENVPAEQPQAKQEARFPPADAVEGRASGAAPPPDQGPLPPVGLIWPIRERSSFRALAYGPAPASRCRHGDLRARRVAFRASARRLRRRPSGRGGGGAQPDPAPPARRDPSARPGARAGPGLPRRASVGTRPQASVRGAFRLAPCRAARLVRMRHDAAHCRPERLLRTINLYQRLTSHRASPCRYVPSCSGVRPRGHRGPRRGRGAWLSTRRLARCHPLGGFGFDPVPGRLGSRRSGKALT